MRGWFGSLRTVYQRDKPQRLPGVERDPVRLVFFSDAVFAIAVTLLVLEIQPPEDFGHLLEGLGRLWPSYLAYAVSFLLIGQVWVNHHVMFEHIRGIDRRILFLNTLLLLDIAFLPFPASVLAGALHAGEGLGVAVVLYGVTFWVAALLFNVLWAHARMGGLVDAGALPDGGRAITLRFATALVWLGVGTVIGVFVPVAGMAVIAAFIPAYYLPIRGE
ncbi:TMEM175 family protein [Asanoa sp. NPDC049573]|uniref:TMEM175 family protein n=1 Tax=Asanoa sp. NPDC049573 TaxID=3155396 RepID=UPI003446E522